MSDTHISAFGTLSEALFIVWREKQLALLLIAFVTIVTLIYLWPLLDWYAPLMIEFSYTDQMDPAMEQQIMDDMSYIFWGLIPLIFMITIPIVIWSRASIGSAVVAMEGGIGALFKRTLWAAWRYICLVGWMILLMFAMMIIFMVIAMIFGASGAMMSGGDPSQMGAMLLIIIPLYMAIIGVIIALTLLYSVSLHGEARDLRLPIYKAFGYMKGNLLRATGALLVAMLVYYVIYFIFAALFIGAIMASSTWLSIIGMFFMLALGNIFYFTWISFGALYAAKVVPELKG